MLVLPPALGVAAVGAATHLVLWSRGFLRGSFGRLRAARRFAWIVLALQLAAFAAGNVMYPTYKVEVRTAYLENREAIVAAQAAEQSQLERIAAREGTHAGQPTGPAQLARRPARVAGWFDVKEHWVALGLLPSLGLVLALAFWDPKTAGREAAPAGVRLPGAGAGARGLRAVL